MGQTVQEILNEYKNMSVNDAASWAAGGNVYEKPPPVIPQNPTSGDKAIDEAASFATGSQWGIDKSKEPVPPDIASLQAGPATDPAASPVTGKDTPGSPQLGSRPAIQAPDNLPATPGGFYSDTHPGWGMEKGSEAKLNPELTAFATKPPAENKFDDSINREIMRLQAGEYSSLAGKNVVSPQAKATIAQLMLGQRSGEATLQHADVTGRFGLAGETLKAGETNELRRLSLEQRASENATREKDFKLRLEEIKRNNIERGEDKAALHSQSLLEHYAKSPEGDNYQKGLFDMVHQGVKLHSSLEAAGKEAYRPMQDAQDAYKAQTGKEMPPEQKEYMKNLHYFKMGWITKKPTKPPNVK